MDKKRTRDVRTLFLRVVLIVIGVAVLFFITKAIIKRTNLPSLHADEITGLFNSKRALLVKIDELTNTIETNKTALIDDAIIREENEKLKAEFGRPTTTHGVLARVLTPPNRSFYDTILIDAGSTEGISVGQTAYAFEEIALGTVSETALHQSTVLLFSAPERTTSGTAEGSDVALTLIGRGNGEYEVRMPRDVRFDIGESISYQSVSTAVLANIEKIVTDPRDPFQRLLAKAPVNLAALKFVIVR